MNNYENKLIILKFYIFIILLFNKLLIYFSQKWGLGIGDWGLGIGDWAQSPIPNPQISNLF